MTEPIPIRAIERQRITRPHEVIETERVVEFATRTPAPAEGLALPCGEHPYSPECCSPMARSGMELEGVAPTRAALPPAPPAPARWWRRWLQ